MGDVGCGSLCADKWPRSTSQTTVVGTTYLNRGLWTGKCNKPVSKCKLSNHRQHLDKWPYDYTIIIVWRNIKNYSFYVREPNALAAT